MSYGFYLFDKSQFNIKIEINLLRLHLSDGGPQGPPHIFARDCLSAVLQDLCYVFLQHLVVRSDHEWASDWLSKTNLPMNCLSKRY